MPNLPVFLAAPVAIAVALAPDDLQVLARGIPQGRAAGVPFHTTLAMAGIRVDGAPHARGRA